MATSPVRSNNTTSSGNSQRRNPTSLRNPDSLDTRTLLSNALLDIAQIDLIAFLDGQTEAVTEYSEPLARRLIEKITVYDEKLVVEFKSGLMAEVEA